jgi:chromate reductase
MISIICGTNRNLSNSYIFAKEIEAIINSKQEECKVLNLHDLPSDFAFENEVYGNERAPLNAIANEFISSSNKFVFVIPEYNGSFPGVLKAFIDSFSPDRIRGKQALLIGIASGRAGNLRGLDHFTGVMNYLNVHVFPIKVAISHCHTLIDENSKRVSDERTIELLGQQVETLLAS